MNCMPVFVYVLCGLQVKYLGCDSIVNNVVRLCHKQDMCKIAYNLLLKSTFSMYIP